MVWQLFHTFSQFRDTAKAVICRGLQKHQRDVIVERLAKCDLTGLESYCKEEWTIGTKCHAPGFPGLKGALTKY